MKNKIRQFLEKIIFKNKKTFLGYHRSIERAAFDGFKEGFKTANDLWILEERVKIEEIEL